MVEYLHPPTLEFVQRMSLQELVRGLLEGSGETEEIAGFGNEVLRRVPSCSCIAVCRFPISRSGTPCWRRQAPGGSAALVLA
ncbi:hypothetical protein SAMN05444161_5656 [Rhizobiales bacterium GAS191]|jgi:hypothetical protein|nr:hypothetical protein SAMN05519103_04851 [Rhizobiales bacterium GAS113]SEE40403.1 hypothetical protein SAMN05444161_5656 [Rhizobiales bacterium GAS191]